MAAETLDIARAKDVDLATLVARHVKLMRRGKQLWGLCPFHQERTASFKVEGQRFHCFGCGADGDVIDWMQRTEGMRFHEAVEALHPETVREATLKRGTEAPSCQIGETGKADRFTADAAKAKVRKARAMWSASEPIAGTRAEAYLRTRHIAEPGNPSLRFIRAFPYTRDVILPAMVAAMMSPSREIVAVQVTMLNPQKPQKASVVAPRKTFGFMGNGAVRLGKAGDALGLAEGTETGLSAMQLTGVPVWCCLGSQRLHQVAVPAYVRELHIFADDDGPGREAAERTAQAHRHRRIQIRFPPAPHGDWNDYLGAT